MYHFVMKITFETLPLQELWIVQCPFSASQRTVREIFQVSNEKHTKKSILPCYAERMDVHCLESGCIWKYIPLKTLGIYLHPSLYYNMAGEHLRQGRAEEVSSEDHACLHPYSPFWSGLYHGSVVALAMFC